MKESTTDFFFPNLKSNQFFLFVLMSFTAAKQSSGKAELGEVLGFPLSLQFLFVTYFSPWCICHSVLYILALSVFGTVPVGNSAVFG